MFYYSVYANEKQSVIHKEIYGHFAEHLGRCIYEGIYVGENSTIPNTNGIRNDVAEALRNLQIPVLRWPGGCFADEYHWKDGIGPKNTRKKMVNTHWGGFVEDNSFGTHEFMELCKQIGCQAYIAGNVGSGTVQEMQEWIEYMTYEGESPLTIARTENGQKEPWKVPFFGIGNENWGCGGNMRASAYADLYRQFQTYVRNFGDNKIYKIACGPGASLENPGHDWLEIVLDIAADKMDGVSMHYYTVTGPDFQTKGSATEFNAEEYYRTLHRALHIDELLTGSEKILNKYDNERRIGIILDEWGTWYDVEPGTIPGFLYQQNTMRDALVAGVSLNVFNKHSERVRMANIAQTVNVLQAVALTEGDKMLLTPTYHVFDLYKRHQDSILLDSAIKHKRIGVNTDEPVPMLHESASMDANGHIYITMCNLSHSDAADIEADIMGMNVSGVKARILTGAMNSYNTFENPESIKLTDFNEIESRGDCSGGSVLKFKLPPVSLIGIELS